MNHDFAKAKKGKTRKSSKNTRKKPAKKRLPGWLLFLSGIVFTLFAELLIYLAVINPDTQQVTTTKNDSVKEPEEKTVKKPTITFYDKLPDMEVKVPNEVVAPRQQESYNYVLQAGSFKNASDAEQQRAEVILLGLEARIEKSRNKTSGTLWHRIIVGPFTSRSELSSARSTLINNGMPAMKIKR